MTSASNISTVIPYVFLLDVTRNRCSDAEDKPSPAEQMEIIFNKFNAGSLVYAKIDRKPWWPAIVTDNPQTLTYFKLESFSEEPVS